eukprot:jgi/Mesvir1/4651/Mv03466-RA.1
MLTRCFTRGILPGVPAEALVEARRFKMSVAAMQCTTGFTSRPAFESVVASRSSIQAQATVCPVQRHLQPAEHASRRRCLGRGPQFQGRLRKGSVVCSASVEPETATVPETPREKAPAAPSAVVEKEIEKEPELPDPEKEKEWPLWLALPLQPGKRRPTKMYEVVKNTIYTFEQGQGILDVIVNVRMTVVVLKSGGLWVHDPVAPTAECLRMLAELEAKHGPVKHIVLATTAVEHKVFLGPFARKFPEAEVYIAPEQWSFPLNLPIEFLGLFPRKAKLLTGDAKDTPWGGELDQAMVILTLGLGPFVEVTFFHKATRTLIVTDAVIQVPSDAPDVVVEDPAPLLFRGKDNNADVMEDTPENRSKGWQKTALFALFLQPGGVGLDLSQPGVWLSWQPDVWKDSFATIAMKLLSPPILQVLVYKRDPESVLAWVDKMASWPFVRIIPAHLQAPIKAEPKDLRRAFAWLEELAPGRRRGLLGGLFPFGKPERSFPLKDSDMATLNGLSASLTASGLLKGSPEEEAAAAAEKEKKAAAAAAEREKRAAAAAAAAKSSSGKGTTGNRPPVPAKAQTVGSRNPVKPVTRTVGNRPASAPSRGRNEKPKGR